MNEKGVGRRVGLLLVSVMLLAILSPQYGAIADLPDALVLRTGSVASVQTSLPVSAEVSGGENASVADIGRDGDNVLSVTAGEESGTAEVVFRLLGLLPVKTMTVTVEPSRTLVPGGRSLGVAVETEGVVVVGSSDLGQTVSPARKAGVRAGDVIRTIDGVRVNSPGELSAQLQAGSAVSVGLVRDGAELALDVTPQTDPRDGAAKLGVWVRESTAGVGTLTYYDPATGGYGALGHAITDVDTGILFPVGDGAVYENEVVGITRGAEGAPGELTGAFFEEEIVLGSIDSNTEAGIFGIGSEGLAEGSLYPEGLPVATRGEIHEGPAQLLTTIDGGEVRAYACEIERVYNQAARQSRSMVIRITDEELLGTTGGIVQGMSGSPLIQDGRLIGAVTHVMVDNPARGYGIFIENMLDAAT